MGTWGVGTFENDEASDWVYELEKSRDLSVLRSTIDALRDATGYLEAPTCVNALAAAEVVAALVGKPASDLPENVTSWVKSNAKLDAKELRAPAVAAIDKILADSELKELWGESGEAENWEATVRDLRGRLSS
jgi:Domain of unknown function (DUF4259)